MGDTTESDTADGGGLFLAWIPEASTFQPAGMAGGYQATLGEIGMIRPRRHQDLNSARTPSSRTGRRPVNRSSASAAACEITPASEAGRRKRHPVRLGDERRVAHLHDDPDGRPRLLGQIKGEQPGDPRHLGLDCGPVGDVPLKGLLPAVAAGHVRRVVHLSVAAAPAQQHQPRPGHRPELSGERVRIGGGQVADGADAQPGQLPGRLGADAPQRVGGPLAEHLEPVGKSQPEHPRRLAEPGGDLGLQLVLPDPHRAVKLGGFPDARRQRPRERFRIRCLHDAEERLVPAEHLHHRAGRPQHGHHRLRDLLVGGPVHREEYRVRQSLRGRAQRQAGVHAILPGLIGGRAHHAALGRVAVAAHHDGPPAQFGVPQHLDRRDELVEVHVQHPPRHVPVVPGQARADPGHDPLRRSRGHALIPFGINDFDLG